MTMDVGPRGGIGHDPDTHRMGTDWNKNGSIDMADGAMNMLVMDYVMKEGAEQTEGSSEPWGRRRSKPKSSLREWMKRHYILVTATISFVVTFILAMAFHS